MSISIGVNNIARSVKSAYVGVDNKARKIKKAYVGVNGIARLIYNEDSKSDSNVMFFGSVDGQSKAYLNNNKNSSIALNNMTEYATGDNDRLGWSDGELSPKGTYFYINSTWNRSSLEFYKIEEGKVELYDTIDQSKFPGSAIGSGSNYQELKIRGCCFSRDEKHLYITTHNVDTSYSNYRKRMYISSFNVTPTGFSHISTNLLTWEGDLYFTLRGSYVAVTDAEDWLYVNLTFQSGSDTNKEYRYLSKVRINDDYSVTPYIATGNTTNYYTSGNPGKIEVTPDGKWVAVYYDGGWSESYGQTNIAYLYYSDGYSLSMVTNINMSGSSGIVRLFSGKLIVCQNWSSYSYASLYVYNLYDNGKYDYKVIQINKSSIEYPNYLFGSTSAMSRDGSYLISSNGYLRRYLYRIDYNANTFTKLETVDFPDTGYRYCSFIGE